MQGMLQEGAQVQYLIKEWILCQKLERWFGGKKTRFTSHTRNSLKTKFVLELTQIPVYYRMYKYCIKLSIQEQPILDIMHKMLWFNWCERHTACQAERVIMWYIFLAFSKMWDLAVRPGITVKAPQIEGY